MNPYQDQSATMAMGEVETRAAKVLEPAERLVASSRVASDADVPEPWRWSKPRVLRGMRMPGDRRHYAKGLLLACLTGPSSSKRLERLFCRGIARLTGERHRPFGGGRSSLAWKLVVALHPRPAISGGVCVLQLTDRRLVATYVQQARRCERYGAAEAGWEVPANQLAWLRMTDGPSRHSSGTYDVGFVDGSWSRVTLYGDPRPFVYALPAFVEKPS